jgi:tetratricopeptide (TPR) repeat protein
VSHDSRITGDSTEAVERAAVAQSLGEALGDSSLTIAADFYLGTARASLGDYRGAANLFRRIARSVDDDLNRRHVGHPEFPAVVARAWLAQSLAELGEFEEGAAFGEEAIRLAEALDHAMSLAYACTRLGHLRAVKGELDRAALLLERGHAVTRDWKITYTAALVTADLGYVYALRGHHAEGLSLLRHALAAYESMKVDVLKPRLLAHLGEAYLLADRIDEAQACAAQCLAYTRARGERGYEAYALRLLGEVGSHRDPSHVKTAEGHYREAGSLAADLGMRPLVGHCHRGLGTLYRQEGQWPAAREHLAAAAAVFRRLAMGMWLEKTEAELRRLD